MQLPFRLSRPSRFLFLLLFCFGGSGKGGGGGGGVGGGLFRFLLNSLLLPHIRTLNRHISIRRRKYQVGEDGEKG